MIPTIFVALCALCWGSFLSMLGYRLVQDASLLVARSFCPGCKKTIAWYDLIPVISWFILKRRCRWCLQPISFLYPCIELGSLALFIFLYTFYSSGLLSLETSCVYALFFSALLVTIRSDTEYLLISSWATLYIIPTAFLASFAGYLPLTLHESILGALLGYFFLWLIAKSFYLIRNKEGIGQGDFELLAMIGSFIGITGALQSVFIGSTLGTFIGIAYIYLWHGKEETPLPFGLFLSLGACIYLLCQIV